MDFGSLFQKSEADLVAMNEQFGRYYQAVVDTPLPGQGEPGGWMVWGMYASMGRRHDYRSAVRDVNAPVLVIHGSEDLQTESASRGYVDAFPNARFQVVENAGHFVFDEQPAAFAAAVSAFLKEL
jgi:pimeloyl-ACP methyl ester carboxylesterase